MIAFDREAGDLDAWDFNCFRVNGWVAASMPREGELSDEDATVRLPPDRTLGEIELASPSPCTPSRSPA
jgi:hypothetical protein